MVAGETTATVTAPRDVQTPPLQEAAFDDDLFGPEILETRNAAMTLLNEQMDANAAEAEKF